MDRRAARALMALVVAAAGFAPGEFAAAASFGPSARWKTPASYTLSPAFYGIKGLTPLNAAIAAESRARTAAVKAQGRGWSSVRLLVDSEYGDGHGSARHFDLGVGATPISLDVVRGKYRGDVSGVPWRAAGALGGSWTAILGHSLVEDGDDALRLSAAFSLQHVRFLTAEDNGHRDKAMAGTMGVSWVRDGVMALNAGWYRASSATRREPLARAILLAAGSPVAEQGPTITFQLAPDGLATERAVRFGVQAGDFAISARDTLALGGVSGTDRRILFTVSKRF